MIFRYAKLSTILFFLTFLIGCAGQKPAIYIPPTQPPAVKSNRPIQVALVLGAGGARGYAHLGVLNALKQAHIPIDLVVGASVGSTVAALYCDNNSVKQAYSAMMAAGFWNFADISYPPSPRGLMQGYRIQKFLLTHMRAKQFSQLKTKLVMVTTDVKTGQTYVIQSGPIAPAAASSATIPGLVKPAYLYGHVLIDGGVTDPVPVNVAQRFHPKLIIAVNISQQLQQKIPFTAVDMLKRSLLIRWNSLTQFSERGADVLIRPLVGQIGTFQINKKKELYWEGYRAAEKAIPQIKRLMYQKHIKTN